MIIENSRKYVNLEISVTVDESMSFFRGRCGMKFYMSLKLINWGLKLHSFVDSKTHYLYNVILAPWKLHKELVVPDKKINYARQVILSFDKK